MAVIPEHEVPDEWMAEIQHEVTAANVMEIGAAQANIAYASLDAYRAANPPTPEPPEVGSWWRFDGYDLCRVSAVDPDGTTVVRWWQVDRLAAADAFTPEEWADDDQRFAPSSPPAGWEETP